MTETVPETDDLIARLREPIWTEDVMQRWDYVRKIVAEGHTGSHPRDIIEADLDGWDEDRREAATALEAAQARIRELEGERDRLHILTEKAQEHAIHAQDRWANARREALEGAVDLMDDIAYEIGARPMSSIHSALCEYRKRIRALMEKPNG